MFYWFLHSVTLCGNPPTTIVVRPPFDKGGKGTGRTFKHQFICHPKPTTRCLAEEWDAWRFVRTNNGALTYRAAAPSPLNTNLSVRYKNGKEPSRVTWLFGGIQNF